ncbi:hypothetical protein FRC12_013918 [Ceratobasidium sp. 428]|nr:hypothetical protein FRC12_013918 [Ceratobasidium sp. 428]
MEEDKLLDLLVSVKNMVRSDPQTARQTLTSHPNLAYALMKEMVVLDVVDPEVLTRTLQAATGVQPTPAPAPAPAPAPPQNYGAYPQQATPSYPPPSSAPPYPPSSAPPYPPTAVPSYPSPSSIPSYPPPSSAPPYPPAPQPQPQPQPKAPSIPPHMYQQSRQASTPPVQSRGPPPSQPPPAAAPVPMGLAPEQQAMIQRLAMLTPDQIAALPPADRAALLELRRQLGLS